MIESVGYVIGYVIGLYLLWLFVVKPLLIRMRDWVGGQSG